MQLYNIERKQQ